jgi:hypothetical protein
VGGLKLEAEVEEEEVKEVKMLGKEMTVVGEEDVWMEETKEGKTEN